MGSILTPENFGQKCCQSFCLQWCKVVRVYLCQCIMVLSRVCRLCEATNQSKRWWSSHTFWFSLQSSCWASWKHVYRAVPYVSHHGMLSVIQLISEW